MKRKEIVINGTAYPCSPTMGAMLRFKKETGREITEINPSSFTDLCTYLWCCVSSAAKRDGKEFNMTLMDFADNVSPGDMEEWCRALAPEQQETADEADGEKKSP